MFKNILKLLASTTLLMAFQCNNEEPLPTLKINKYRVNITGQSSFSISDTIWIEGTVSSKAYYEEINDSIFFDAHQENRLKIMKFIQPTQNVNCIDARDNFQIIRNVGVINVDSFCETKRIITYAEISEDSLFYNYKIGLKPLTQGDFFIYCHESIIHNENRNEFIMEHYRIDEFSNQTIGFIQCGSTAWIDTTNSESYFYFKVE
ncbi:hypothetical protein SAMN04489761_0845 [Tenacibaculum sp. MAR_2009_124]|uniref:hypothetical protein n=1 Tax=Tenacibaculum sp. MAR_2009_124 TaxID=1250059 RepID=UPI00089A36BC|nr:hypothetical protein [Tenacibaculum sp. MAR_2009_124]SEB45961.1 hypothetical protein SAMN04489761_0845 [Tenacibaculum sp. MAR_2009_124]